MDFNFDEMVSIFFLDVGRFKQSIFVCALFYRFLFLRLVSSVIKISFRNDIWYRS
jgi:hypothetical protein